MLRQALSAVLPFDVMVITDPSQGGWLDALVAAVEAAPSGRLAVQVRAESAGAGELRWLTESLRAALGSRRVPLIVNDRVDVALLSSAHGVHLKESGLEVRDARALLGAEAIVGASCHDAAGIARRSDADYVVLGPFAEVPGKSAALGPARFEELVRGSKVPVLALGGIDAHRAGDAIRAGAWGVAVVRGILAAPDPAAATRAILDAIDRARSSPII